MKATRICKNNRIKSGSLTLETAIVLPIFMILTISVIWIIEMINTYARAEYALHETARQIAIMSYPVEYLSNLPDTLSGEDGNLSFLTDNQTDAGNGTSDDYGEGIEEYFNDYNLELSKVTDVLTAETFVRALFIKNYGIANLNNSCIRHQAAGLHFFRSSLSNEENDVELTVTYTVEPIINVFKAGELKLANKVRIHAWTGYVSEECESSEYVYITDEGGVYHTNASCTYLRLSIKTLMCSDVEKQRNADGKKYKECLYCKKKDRKNQSDYVYLTDYGEAYHTRLSCRGLKRTVYKVKKSQVTGMSECSRCREYKEEFLNYVDEYN